jgi:hypothetical protein
VPTLRGAGIGFEQRRADPSLQTRVRVGYVAQSGKAPALTGFAAERASARIVN